MWQSNTKEFKATFDQRLIASTKEISDLVLILCDPKSRWINGSIVNANCGLYNFVSLMYLLMHDQISKRYDERLKMRAEVWAQQCKWPQYAMHILVCLLGLFSFQSFQNLRIIHVLWLFSLQFISMSWNRSSFPSILIFLDLVCRECIFRQNVFCFCFFFIELLVLPNLRLSYVSCICSASLLFLHLFIEQVSTWFQNWSCICRRLSFVKDCSRLQIRVVILRVLQDIRVALTLEKSDSPCRENRCKKSPNSDATSPFRTLLLSICLHRLMAAND